MLKYVKIGAAYTNSDEYSEIALYFDVCYYEVKVDANKDEKRF